MHFPIPQQPLENDDLHATRPSVRIKLSQVRLTNDARVTLGLAVKEIAAEFGLDAKAMTRHLSGEIYWRMDEDSLVFVLHCEELDADMFVNIPEGHWSFKGDSPRLN